MTLAGVQHNGKPGYPWLVFLHGFSGDCREWQAVGESLRDYPRLYLDLPGHGESASVSVAGFNDLSDLLASTLLSYNILNYWLVGYSLGGRVAMYHACQAENIGLRGLIVEGGNPGLADPEARKARLASDQLWAQRFRERPVAEVLEAWYQQPVFRSLTDVQREALVELRSHNNPATLADMLESTSLGAQPDLHTPLHELHVPFHYICGERDEKFRAAAAGLGLSPHLIPAAGHNAHRENPAAFRACLLTLLRQYIEVSP